MSTSFCKKDQEDQIRIRQKEALFRCKKCGETAPKEKHLCKPKKNR